MSSLCHCLTRCDDDPRTSSDGFGEKIIIHVEDAHGYTVHSMMIFGLLQRIRRMMAGSGIGRVPGVAQVYRFIYRRFMPSGIVSIPVLSHRMYVDTESGGLHPHLLEEGVYEKEVTQLFQRLLRPGMTFVDIGANIGYFSILAASIVGSTGRVYAFEPDPENVEFLRKNVALNRCQDIIRIEPCCLSDERGTVVLYRDATNRGNHSLAQSNIVRERSAVHVPCVTLDHYLSEQESSRAIDVLKIDTQGAELLILRGARRTLQTHAKIRIIFEFWPYGISNMGNNPLLLLDLLRKEGFTLRCIDLPVKIGALSPAEIVCVANGKKANDRGSINILAFRQATREHTPAL